MEERTLYMMATIVTILGLVVLFFYADVAEAPLPENPHELQPSETVTIRGVITSLRQQGKAYFIRVEGEYVQSTDVIIFDDQNLFLEEGNYVEVQGTVEEYHNQKEVIAQKVVVK